MRPQNTKEWREYWNRYDKYSDYGIGPILETIYNKFPERNKSILDLACGRGTLAHNLSLLEFFAVGMDFSTKAGGKCHRFVRADMTAIPFKSQSFDITICLLSVNYLSNHNEIEWFAYEVCRITKAMIILTFNDNWQFGFDDLKKPFKCFDWQWTAIRKKTAMGDGFLYVLERKVLFY